MTPTTALQAQLEEMERRKDGAYEERNRVVAALAKCFPSGVARTAIEGWSEDWHGCVYIDLPTGQVSWHFHDSQAHLFAGLPAYTRPWDGHDTPEKYRRVAALSAPAQDAQDAVAALLSQQKPLEPDFAEVLEKDSWDLYARTQPATPVDAAATVPDNRDAVAEALRKALNGLPRYSFLLDGLGNVRRVPERFGAWIEWQAAHELFDPVVVDSLLPAAPAAHPVAVTADDLIDLARRVEGLKRECGMNPESPIAIQNGRYMAISYALRDLAKRAAPTAPQAVPLTDEQLEQERALFERKCGALNFKREAGGSYSLRATQVAWAAWWAARQVSAGIGTTATKEQSNG